MNTIVIQTESKDHLELFSKLAKSLGEKVKKFNDKTLEDAMLVADIEDGLSTGLLDANQKNDFLADLKRNAKK